MNAAEAESYVSTVSALPPHKRTVGDAAAIALARELARQRAAYDDLDAAYQALRRSLKP